MMTTRNAALAVFAALAGTLAACSEQAASPEPGPGDGAAAARAEADAPPAAESAETGGTAQTPSGSTVQAGGLTFDVPAGWSVATPSNIMRVAELHAADGAAVAAFSLAGGPPDANIQRWVGQFSNPGGEIVQGRDTTTIGGYTVHTVAMTGEYRGMGMSPPEPDSTMYAAIIERPGDQHLFIKMTGPREAMAGLEGGWESLLQSLRAD